jgi:ankyrin repeat protein
MFFGRPFRSRAKPKEEPAAAEKGGPRSEELEMLHQQLIAAIEQQEPLSVVKGIVESNPRVLQKKNEAGMLPLHFAAKHASLAVVQRLIDACPEALRVNNELGYLPLHLAARYSSLEVVRCMVDKAPEALRTKDENGRLPLHLAACGGSKVSSEVVQYLADKHPEAMLVKDKNGVLPLHVYLASAQRGASLEVVQCLADTYPNVLLVKGEYGRLPLHVACHYGVPLEVVQYLAENRPEALRNKTNNGWLPLHSAVESDAPTEVVQCLADMCPEALLVKAEGGWIKGSLPLHIAAWHSRLTMVQCLADKLPEALLVKDNIGWLPIHAALLHEYGGGHRYFNTSFEKVKCLADKCPKALLVKGQDGWLPLHIAAQKYSLEVVQCLADNCPKTLQEKTNDGSLPVDLAKHNKCDPEVVVWLEAAMRKRQAHELVTNDLPPPAAPAPVPDPHAQDRDRIRKAIEDPSHEPALVSVAYVASIQSETFLGDGFFGVVFKGSDTVLAQEFAIKSINTEILRAGTKQDVKGAMKTFKTEQEVRERWMAFVPPFRPSAREQLTFHACGFRRCLASGTPTLRRCSRTPTRWPRETPLATTSCTSWQRRGRSTST